MPKTFHITTQLRKSENTDHNKENDSCLFPLLVEIMALHLLNYKSWTPKNCEIVASYVRKFHSLNINHQLIYGACTHIEQGRLAASEGRKMNSGFGKIFVLFHPEVSARLLLQERNTNDSSISSPEIGFWHPSGPYAQLNANGWQFGDSRSPTTIPVTIAGLICNTLNLKSSPHIPKSKHNSPGGY